mgnify:CR=1 FL=1
MLKIVTTILCVYMLVRCVLPLRCKRPLKTLLALLVLAAGFLIWDVVFALSAGMKLPLLRNGFRMVVFSIIIMIVVLFFRRGLMGDRELSDVARSLRARLSGKSKKKEAAK